MKATLLRVGRGKCGWADAAVADYSKRLRRKLPFDEVCLKPAPFRGQVDPVRRDEATRILAKLKRGDRLIALDERGELPTTEDLAGWVDASAKAGIGRVVFAIGGPYGHGPEVRDRAWRTLALSRMVLNHEVARVVLVEQLYRVSTVLWGGSYHH